MTPSLVIFHNGPIFDGQRLHQNSFACFENDRLTRIGTGNMPQGVRVDLGGDLLCPGYVDLQVNGGGGVMLNGAPSVDSLRRIAAAHHGLGVRRLLPTLITDGPEITRATIHAAIEALGDVPGIAGLHLEGPHLSVARKGAHEARFIRPMTDQDEKLLLEAARALPLLKVTLAPETVTEPQVARLAGAGVLVSLGHTDADFDTCQRYVAAGARCATHLFNAMSQIGNRAPGLAGAAIANGALSVGLIADGVHVHPETIGIAWRAKRGPGRIFLVSDAMAVAGTSDREFLLGGRRILRREGQLRLEDDTLAGADLDLTKAVSVLVNRVGIDLSGALAAATSVPAALCGLANYGLQDGTDLADVIRIRSDLSGVVPLEARPVLQGSAGLGRN